MVEHMQSMAGAATRDRHRMRTYWRSTRIHRYRRIYPNRFFCIYKYIRIHIFHLSYARLHIDMCGRRGSGVPTRVRTLTGPQAHRRCPRHIEDRLGASAAVRAAGRKRRIPRTTS